MASSQNILNNAQNSTITGNTFNTYLKEEPSLQVLHKRVAPNAILNAKGRPDELKCHSGTRVEVINNIERWRAGQDSSTIPIFRLVGHAGTGKSAIMQTLAERWKEEGIPLASFFFLRTDDTRNSSSPLIATLLYQLIPLYPSLAKAVAAVLAVHPLIFDSKLDDQLSVLIVAPLRKIQESSTSYRRPTLLIDGLDECVSDDKRGQRQILAAFDKVMAQRPCPLQLLVASRDESQIQAGFKTMSTPFCTLSLDNVPGVESDIRVFVRDNFELIKQTHPLADDIEDHTAWPSPQDVDDIVRKSSGQFIYAVTAMRFIMDSPSSPVVSLNQLRKPKDDAATKSPFSQLDALYTHILSQATDQQALKHMLYAQFYLKKQRSLLFCKCAKNTHTDDSSCKANDTKLTADLFSLLIYKDFKYGNRQYSRAYLAALAPLARYDGKVLVFHHASFADFILSRSRAGEYFVDLSHTSEFNTWAIIAYFCAGFVRMKTGEVIRLVFASPRSIASLTSLLGRSVKTRAKSTFKSITF